MSNYASTGVGVSIGQLLTGTIPKPTRELKWGENIPPEIMTALRNGETALLKDADGNPHSVVLMDYFGTIREKQFFPGTTNEGLEAHED
jgi:hypothetical protein